MSFLNAIGLWGPLAAAGIGVPIVIHLLSRYRSRVVNWAAMELLRKALVVRARRVRLEDLILLLLRCAAAALVALALARPVLTGSGWAGSSRTGVVIGLDASFSMGHKPGEESRFDAARRRVREILATLKAGDTVTLVLMGKRPLVPLTNVASDDERLVTLLKTASPLAEPLGLEPCLAKIKNLAAEIKAPNKECYLVTDGQAVTWEHVSTGARQILQALRASCAVYFLPAGSENAENLAVTRLVVASGVLRRGAVVRFTADVRNTGRHPALRVPVRLFLDGVPDAGQTIDRIGPGETVSVPLFVQFKRAGVIGIRARLEVNDPLPIDNARYLVADITERVKILCIEPNPPSNSLRGETGFLRAALLARSGEDAPDAPASVRVETVASGTSWHSRLSSFDIVVLANVPEIGREQAAALCEFVRRGGGLMVFLGDKIDPGLINGQLRDAETPLLPAEVGNAVGEDEASRAGSGSSNSGEGWALAMDLPDHPVTRVLSALPQEQLVSTRFQRYFKLAPHKSATVLLRLDSSRDPILVEHSLGHGKVLLFASTANRAWNDMVVSPAYLMLLQQAATYLTRKPYEKPVAVADPLAFELPPDRLPESVSVRDPQGNESSVPVTRGESGPSVASLSAQRPGIYAARFAATLPEIKIAANVDPDESAVAVLREGALNAAVGPLSTHIIGQQQDLRTVVRQSRYGRELWRSLLLLALAALVVESLLGRWFVSRMTRAQETLSKASVKL